jgi:MFS family permease
MLLRLLLPTGVGVPSVSHLTTLEMCQQLLNWVGFYNCGWFGGSIPAAAVTYGCNNIDNDYSWRIPFILQCFACIIVVCSIWFIPESPRWQIAHGQEEKAIAFLTKYHGNGNRNARLVLLEVEEMREGIRLDGIDKRWWDCEYFPSDKPFICRS